MTTAVPGRVLVVGEVNVDLVLKGLHAEPAPGQEVLADDFLMTPGSSSMICAMGLARLGNAVAFHGRLGADAWGHYCLGAMREAGIDVASLQPEASLRTGITVSLSTPRDRALVTFSGAIAALRAEDVSDALLADAGHLHAPARAGAGQPRWRELRRCQRRRAPGYARRGAHRRAARQRRAAEFRTDGLKGPAWTPIAAGRAPAAGKERSINDP